VVGAAVEPSVSEVPVPVAAVPVGAAEAGAVVEAGATEVEFFSPLSPERESLDEPEPLSDELDELLELELELELDELELEELYGFWWPGAWPSSP